MNNNKFKILVIEDEINITGFISSLFDTEGYQTLSATTCREGELMFHSHTPDLVILDLGLPDADGTRFIIDIRKEFVTPIIVLSARSEEEEKVRALDLGANDYITKPFGSAELKARVRSALRSVHNYTTQTGLPGTTFTLGGLTIDYEARRIFLNSAEIPLTRTEFNIVVLLSEHCGKVLTYSAIIKDIWGTTDSGSIKKLQVNMANIRKKMGMRLGENSYIVNELGIGYRMQEP